MSNPRLPVELLDHVVDLLHDTEDALRNCCLVSKSWIPRTRKHLFAHIKIRYEDNLKSWKEAFPDPSTSPAHYAETLSIRCLHAVTAADAEPGGWITGFSRVVHFDVTGQGLFFVQSKVPPTPFHGFSPVVKSLRFDFDFLPSSRIFNLALSFPLLEDLTVIALYDGAFGNKDNVDGLSAAVQPSNPPIFTGSLELIIKRGMELIVRRLLSLPGGIHFRKLALGWFREEDISLTAALVEGCSSTLESLHLICGLGDQAKSVSIDLSKATKLKDASFLPGPRNVEWVTMTLQTITPAHRDLRQISIYVPRGLVQPEPHFSQTTMEEIRGQWLGLDRLLIQFWESRSIRLKVTHAISKGEMQNGWIRYFVEGFLPEIAERGIIDVVES